LCWRENGDGETDKRQKTRLLFPCCTSAAIITTAESPETIGLDDRRGRLLLLDLLPNSAIYVHVSDELRD
jgi:hypothetical protein